MSNIQEIRCKKCGKVLLEAGGEVKKICPKCGSTTHRIVTSIGLIDIDENLNVKIVKQ